LLSVIKSGAYSRKPWQGAGTATQVTRGEEGETLSRAELGGRIPELDGVRGLAIAMVVVFHYSENVINPGAGLLQHLLSAGLRLAWSGVDLFFVLSGFLIGGILIDAREASNYFQVFYTRRFFRIVPIYAVLLLVLAGMAQVATRLPHVNLGALFYHSLPWYSYVTFTQNFWAAGTRNMGAGGLAVTWSLAVEEQFYLTLPFLVRILPRRQLVTFTLAGICVAPLLRAVSYYFFDHNTLAAYVLMPCRADALLLGVLAAVLTRDADWKQRITRTRLFFRVVFPVLVIGLFILTKTAPWGSSPIMSVVRFSWLAFFYFCVLLFVLTRPASWLGGVFRNPVLRWLGTIAYGVYLLHQPVRGVILGWLGGLYLTETARLQNLLPTLAALTLTLLVARLSWRYFERPLIRVGHRARYRFADAERTATRQVKAAPVCE
jgi:peptidoglycan/LPS O-acetylase OafA/YrhL